MPRGDGSFWEHGESDTKRHYDYIQQVKQTSSKYMRIRIPGCILAGDPDDPYLIEEKFHMVPYDKVPNSLAKTAVEQELEDFVGEYDLCDIDLADDHNAAFLEGRPLQIGVFDFDCHHRH